MNVKIEEVTKFLLTTEDGKEKIFNTKEEAEQHLKEKEASHILEELVNKDGDFSDGYDDYSLEVVSFIVRNAKEIYGIVKPLMPQELIR